LRYTLFTINTIMPIKLVNVQVSLYKLMNINAGL